MIILADIGLSFVTDNYSEPGERLNNTKIAWRYFKSYFFFDLLSSLPGLMILEE